MADVARANRGRSVCVTFGMARHAVAVLVYIALTLALTWPLGLQLNSAIPADLGDPLLSTWTLWWNATVWPLSDRWWDGTMFFPARHTLTLSDHRLGIGIISTPVIWLGGSPVAAYNVAFLASFALSAIAAFALCFALTRHHGAAFIGGLVYGFNPFRAGHLSHLELLCSYWLPVALLAMHRWRATRKHVWLVALTIALTMQALTSAYYFAFFAVLIALWGLWFAREFSLKELATLAVSVVVPLGVVAPILMRYREAHAAMGLARTITDVENFSADLIGVITAPRLLAFWNTPLAWDRPEGALYPGVIAVAVVVLGAMITTRTATDPLPSTTHVMRRVLLAGSAAAALFALVVALFGPFVTEIAGVRISGTRPFKALTVALLLLSLWFLTSRRMRAAWHKRSTFALYVIATVAMWLFALGPTGHVMGERFLYRAPYSWLMLIPGVDTSFRVPARFGMLAALTLCVAVSLAWARYARLRSPRVAAVATFMVAAAIVIDSWIEPLPLHPPPRPLADPASIAADAVVLELPLGAFEDAAAMYRSLTHGRPTVNGLSGYAPPHYQVLHAALTEGRVDAIAGIAEFAPLVVFVDREAAGQEVTSRVRAFRSATLFASNTTHDIILIPRAVRPDEPDRSAVDLSATVRMRTGHASVDAEDLPLTADGDRTTGWLTATQEGTEEFVADLGDAHDICGVVLAMGAWPGGFPRTLRVRTSTNGRDWQDAWHGDVSALAVRGAIEDQRDTAIPLPFEARSARYVQIRQLGWSAIPWAVAEFGAILR